MAAAKKVFVQPLDGYHGLPNIGFVEQPTGAREGPPQVSGIASMARTSPNIEECDFVRSSNQAGALD